MSIQDRGDKMAEKQPDKKGLTLSRRDFLKSTGIAGLTAGAVGASSFINSKPAFAGEKTGQPIVDFTVKEVDQPKYKTFFEGSENLKRFHQANEAFKNKDLAKKNFDGKPWFVKYEETVMQKLTMDKPPAGYTLIDQTLANVSWTSYKTTNFFSWEPIGAANLKRLEVVGKWEGTPEENNKIVKKAAQMWGPGETGVAEVNEQWFYSHEANGTPIIFSDKHDKPVQTKEAWYIPKTMKSLIVMVIPMYEPVRKYVPSALAGGAVGTGYSLMAEKASKMAEFLRGLGYNAIPMGNEIGLSVPMAIDAGLGELGRHGLLVNPKWGSWIRISKVLTDMPIAPDKPIDFGVAEFCRTCMKCAENCPSESISFDKDPSYEIKCPSNNPGMKKWYVDTWSCLTFWTENGAGCTNCQGICPYNKPHTWIHDVVKGISAKTTVFNSTFAALDDILGYGGTVDENNPEEWWKS